MAESAATTEVGSVFVSNYPPYSAWSGGDLGAVEQALDRPPEPGTPLGLYLHIPFCRRRCKFCYFKVYIEKNSDEVQAYLDTMAREVELYAGRRALDGRPVDFVYFGGGTPSFISVRHLRGLVKRVQAAIPWKGAREITFECEPGTLSRAKLEAIRDIGVTRLSLGVENFNDDILAENGRAHLSKEIDRVLPWIRDMDFHQLNIDLIAGMVGETWETWRETVRRTLAAAPDSVTIYQMELPYNTLYSRDVLTGRERVPVAGWDTKRAWQGHAFQELEKAGYQVSSAYTMVRRKGEGDGRFIYRDALWHGGDMLGVGVASFSHLAGVHFQNAASWQAYLDTVAAGRLPLDRAYATGPEDRLIRELILQLKLGRVQTAYFQDKFGADIRERFRDVWSGLAGEGLLRDAGASQLELTRDGLLQVDHLLPRFYAPRFQNIRYT